ncbi:MAG: glutamate synthase small chain [bacterium]
MGQLGGFLRIARSPTPQRDPGSRVADFREVYEVLPAGDAADQGARCMDCGVPFCHQACPLGNLIPDWNDLVHADEWRTAIEQLHATNDFPEFTGRICPAPCEPACVLAINDDPVAIKQVELAIVERAWDEGWIHACPPAARTGRRVAVVGSGPAGLAAAAQLNRAGHAVTVYERDEAPGGLLRFGVPDFKLEKWVVQRRTALMEEEGVIVRCGADIGRAEDGERVLARHDAVVVAIGARVPRDLAVPGRELDGVHFAMEYLYQRNRWVAARDGRAAPPPPGPVITAAGRHVVVIGGGDTAMDCIANAHREQPLSVTLLDTYPTPVGTAAREIVPWPAAPKRLASTYALDEGGERLATRTVTELVGAGGHVTRVRGAEAGPPPDFAPLPETGFEIPADLVLVAIGFAHPEHAGLLEQLAVDLDARGNVRAPAYATSRAGVFAAGDARRGQSLVVTAIAEGRRCARTVDRFLAAR